MGDKMTIVVRDKNFITNAIMDNIKTKYPDWHWVYNVERDFLNCTIIINIGGEIKNKGILWRNAVCFIFKDIDQCGKQALECARLIVEGYEKIKKVEKNIIIKSRQMSITKSISNKFRMGGNK